MTTDKIIEYSLRIAVFGEFFGHGVFALQGKESWIGWIQQITNVDTATATTILTGVGVLDIVVAILVLCWKNVPRAVLLWAAIWGFWTALIRPIVGEPIWDFVERWANWGAPLALLLLRGWPKSAKDWIK
ncbi:MAG: hypothetical protein WC654_02890 [Patescibacteria group bacterium]